MVLFKINGERNSGTTFLTNILKINKFPSYEHKINGIVIYHWKHGVPNDGYKKLDEKVVDLFIFRNLDDLENDINIGELAARINALTKGENVNA